MDDDERNPIVVAMENGAPLQVIRDLVEGIPDLLRLRDDDEGYLPIHYAIDHVNGGHQYVPCLLEAWPESARETTDDECRYLPAHLVCLNYGEMDVEDDASVELPAVVRAVVEAEPQALQEKDGEGCLPLHLAFRLRPPPLDIITYLVEMHPAALRATDDEGNTPFHEAVRSHEPRISHLKYLFERWTECVRQRNNLGYVPFFWAAGNNNLPDDVLRYVFGLWPEAIHQKDEHGGTPLHRAARTGCRTGVDFLLRQRPDMALHKTDAGRIPMHDAAAGKGSETVVRLLVEHRPDSVREACNDGYLPLHEAAREGKVDVVRYLVSQSPDTVRIATNKGWLPIHLALQFRPWDENSRQGAMDGVQLLLDAFPESVGIATSEGYLPLHVAAGLGECERDSLSDDVVEDQRQMAPQFEHDLVQLLVGRAPASVGEYSKEGELPVHCAICGGKSWPAIRYLFESFPEAEEGVPESTQYKTKKGTPVLHLAIDWAMSRLELVQSLVEYRRHFLEDTDASGGTPLHYAAFVGHLSDFWRYLVAQRPQSLRQANLEGCLPLHLYLTQMLVDREDAQFLVEADPGALQVANNMGNLPIHAALYHPSNHVPLDVVELLVDSSPPTLRHKNRQGLLPLHVAALVDSPLDVLHFLATADPEAIYHELRRPSSVDSTRSPPRSKLRRNESN
jgi:ankyrin repeat protein